MHELTANLEWTARNSTRLGIALENRERKVEYNQLATEAWESYRPYVEHIFRFSANQKVSTMLKYSQVADLHLNQTYREGYLVLDYNLRIKRRGKLDQKIMMSNVQADVNGIPYSIFSGRQPGDNWKYSLTGRYTFSSRFQLSTNYSIQKRGSGKAEQYLRIEGRTHF